MAATAESRDPQQAGWDQEKSREVRLGLVMYGGVSLAIYINGVAQELFRAVRGRGVYRLIKALTDSDVVVDVLSGTSAGGINGIYLSYALCNNKDFAQFANLWREHGDINKLLRSPDSDIPKGSSFLDSEGYYQPRLEEAFRQMGDYIPDPGEDPSPINELDLFVTGTDVDGRIYTQFDDAGHPIDIKDHRAVFLLKHRAGRKEPFKPDPANPEITYRALATLSRLTSCFPAAFAPVRVALVEEGDGSPDAKLQAWGKLGKEASFLDGGLLDNKPFTYTLKAIFSRTADREVDRKLFYVEPDPEALKKVENATNPNFLQAVLAALIGIPGYESIAEDLRLLAERNSKLQQYNRLIKVKEIRGGKISKATRQLYDRSRLIALSERVVQGLFRQDGHNQQVPPKLQERAARLVRAFDKLDFNFDRVVGDFDVHFRMRRIFRLVYLIYDRLYAAPAPNEKPVAEEQKERYRSLWKALNRQIKLYEVLLTAMESLVDDAPIRWQDVEEGREEEIWALVQGGYYRLLDDTGPAAQRIVLDDLDAVFADGAEGREWMPQTVLTAIHADLRDVGKTIVKEVETNRFQPAPQTTRSVLRRLDDCEQRLLDRFVPDAGDPVRQAYDEFEELDAHVFPLEMVGNLHEKDIIETIRISPRDANRGFSALDLQDNVRAKVAGDSIYHFGGFFKRSWRSNDILWGRLDGLCQIVETLLEPNRVADLVRQPEERQRIRRRFLRDDATWELGMDPRDLFPRSGERTQEILGRWLRDLLGDEDAARQQALKKESFETLLSLLVEAAQLEVIGEDLPNVITDAIQEQSEWNRFQSYEPPKPPAKETAKKETAKAEESGPATEEGPQETISAMLPWVFQAPGGRLDPLVATTAAAWRMQEGMADLEMGRRPPARPRMTRLGRFFQQSYRVGSERLIHDVPTLVLLEILAKVLLVGRTCVLGLFGNEAPRIRRSFLFRLCIDWPLRAFYALVGVSRRSPGLGLGLFLGLGAVSLLAMLVGFFWWDTLILPAGKGFNLRNAAIFLGVPGAILLLQVTFLLSGGRRVWRRGGLWSFFVGLASSVALVFGIIEWETIYPLTALSSLLKLVFLVILPVAVLLVGGALFLHELWRRPRQSTPEEREERERNLRELRQVAEQALSERFGPLPRKVRLRLARMGSIEDLGRLLARSSSVSATDLGFPELEPPKPEKEELPKAS